jgi:hypothetical protein
MQVRRRGHEPYPFYLIPLWRSQLQSATLLPVRLQIAVRFILTPVVSKPLVPATGLPGRVFLGAEDGRPSVLEMMVNPGLGWGLLLMMNFGGWAGFS